jgi:HEAT repeat protein/cyclophilin family peptidyl-prolyl cis-trans isomerase
MTRPRSITLLAALFGWTSTIVLAQGAARAPLAAADIDAIAELLMLEDTRRFDEEALARLLRSTHPEVRRRAVIAVGRIVNPRGAALLVPMRGDRNPDIVATVAFAAGQLKDPAAVPWLADVLTAASTPPAVGREAAIALGKIRTPDARVALAGFLTSAPVAAASSAVAGEALLAIGRFAGREDLTPIVRWTTARDAGVRWRAAWALFRPRDPAAFPHLLRLSADASADVRFWAMRGLAPPPTGARGGRGTPPDAAPEPPASPIFDRAAASARLREGARDPDRRVRTEAVRALVNFDDDESVAVVLAALDSPDAWISVSAAEGLANARFQSRASQIVPRFVAAAAPTRPSSLRVTVLAPLVRLAPEAALGLATALARDGSVVIRTTARAALQQLGDPGRAALDALAADPTTPPVPPATGRGTTPSPAGGTTPRTLADYRRIVERWVVPDYKGAAKPRTVWETPRGPIEIELYPGDAPLGVEFLVQAVESGDVAGTEFGRLVPNFVAQQRPIRNVLTLRDEVSRRGLARGNLSWASSGLDTGRPGYTLATAPHPHIEGDFTALGRIVRGLEAADRLELGDAVTAARMQ